MVKKVDKTEQLFEEIRLMATQAIYRGDQETLNRIVDMTFPIFEKMMQELQADIEAKHKKMLSLCHGS